MNIYSIIITALICATVITVIGLLLRKPISFRIIRSVELPVKAELPKPAEAQTPNKSTDASENKTDTGKTEVISMDGVIKNLNELMGVQTYEGEE